MKIKSKKSAETLLELVNKKELKGDVAFQQILEHLGERAFGIALLFFALPSALPFSAIPGVSFIFSVPISIFAFQLILGRKTLWLPKILADRTVPHKTIAKVVHKTVPYLKKLEYLLKPRLFFMTSRVMEIINGIVIFFLSIFLMLPIPFSNFIFAFLLIIFSLGFIEKDGLFLIAAIISTVIYISFIAVVIIEAIRVLF